MSKNKEIEPLEPFRASIRVKKNELFEETYFPSTLHWKSGEHEGYLRPACLTKELKKLFDDPKQSGKVLHDIEPKKESENVLKDKIEGLPFVKKGDLEYDGQNWIKVCVGGETNSQIQGYLERIQSFCDQNDIGYEKLCIYTCIEGPNQAKQLELTSKFCQDIEKVKRGI